MKRFAILMALFAVAGCAADVAGTWKASVETPNGSFENTFVFKVDGNKLTGTSSNQMMGETPISDGKVDGDDVTFNVVINRDGNEFKLAYKGKVTGNEMKLTITLPQGDRTFEMTAKKAAS
jgi:hypothetical protein